MTAEAATIRAVVQRRCATLLVDILDVMTVDDAGKVTTMRARRGAADARLAEGA